MSDEEDQKQKELIRAMKDIKKKYASHSSDIVKGDNDKKVKKTSPNKSITDFIDEELEKDYKRFQEKIQRKNSHENVDKMKMIKIINNFLTQYLDGYVLVGIDVAGNDSIMTQYSKPSDYRAVSHLMESYFSGELGGLQPFNDLEDDYEE